ncbi:MAG: damage-inducible protein CinA [Burkholderiales bacterium PBB6]|nr:MAG: damage-inducible protein CinA [Burkholderiales bacterium PBB6]
MSTLLLNTDALTQQLPALADALRARGAMMCAAESCTGGLIAALCTSVAGSSDWFDRGFVTYSNEAKTQMLGVPAALIDAHGAVSEAVALAMAEGALLHSRATLSVAVTGIAGPGGAVPGKPVGTVWLALGWREAVDVEKAPEAGAAQGDATIHTTIHTTASLLNLDGDRTAVRSATVQCAIGRLLALLIDGPTGQSGSSSGALGAPNR